ncbi:MAG TPA: hypothetical protein VHH36_08425 [Candidatus Thermoplasmatota archaeon]|nr:hypothetical protein [Candidatus Thermoplasmatota archaeon]
MTKLPIACLALLAALVAAPVALAQNETNNYDVDLNPGDNGDDDTQEATGWFGMSTTVVVVLLILAVLVIALVVAVASRGRDLP